VKDSVLGLLEGADFSFEVLMYVLLSMRGLLQAADFSLRVFMYVLLEAGIYKYVCGYGSSKSAAMNRLVLEVKIKCPF
jgi:hypothetical protein